MSFFTLAHLALLLLGVLGMSAQAHALKCFAADGAYLKEAVNKVVGGTWTDADADTDEYGPIENWCTKEVTTMRNLFYGKSTFNAGILESSGFINSQKES